MVQRRPADLGTWDDPPAGRNGAVVPKAQETCYHQPETLDYGEQGHLPVDESEVAEVARRDRFVGQRPAQSGPGE